MNKSKIGRALISVSDKSGVVDFAKGLVDLGVEIVSTGGTFQTLKEAGLPQMVVDNTPKYLRRTKVPVVKAKIGAKIMTLMCENKVFEVLPVKKEVKAVVSGLYITEIKSVRGGSIEQPEKKKGFFKK